MPSECQQSASWTRVIVASVCVASGPVLVLHLCEHSLFWAAAGDAQMGMYMIWCFLFKIVFWISIFVSTLMLGVSAQRGGPLWLRMILVVPVVLSVMTPLYFAYECGVSRSAIIRLDHESTNEGWLSEAVGRRYWYYQSAIYSGVARHYNAAPATLRMLYEDRKASVYALASNPSTPHDIIDDLYEGADPALRMLIKKVHASHIGK